MGLPIACAGRLFNCAALVAGNRVLGVVPKGFLPNTGEFYEQRWFTPADLAPDQTILLNGVEVPFGNRLLFCADNLDEFVIGIEICEDLWSVEPPSGRYALAGATVILNPSASNELLGKVSYRQSLVMQQSARCIAAYLYAGAGPGESTTDTVYGGHSLIVENGQLLAETERFQLKTQWAMADIDVQQLSNERLRNSSYSAAARSGGLRRVDFSLPQPAATKQAATRLHRSRVSATPFIPEDPQRRSHHCQETVAIQSTSLAKRLQFAAQTGSGRDPRAGRNVTIGISGGLDSTLALLITIRAFDLLELPRQGIVAISMPGYGTTSRTRGNAEHLAQSLGVTLRSIPIEHSVAQHFRDIGHDEALHNATYQNAQARERTQILMDVASQIGGFNIGTGDLSEFALGYCTYNGDHSSMYHINAGVPKTLVRCLVEWFAACVYSGEIAGVLRDICATPSTPELLPPNQDGSMRQVTQAIIGPDELHDFFLFYAVRYSFAPRKIHYLACHAFGNRYQQREILKWLVTFYYLFFANQFKRSSMPDGPKVGSVALSPRADWRMPSDALNTVWLLELEEIRRSLSRSEAPLKSAVDAG